jgi:hypothetical protein
MDATVQVADALRDALRRVRELEAQLKVAESFHTCAVAQRDAAWHECAALKAQLRAQETSLTRALLGQGS